MNDSQKDTAPAWLPPLLGVIMLALVARVLMLGASALIVYAFVVFSLAVATSALAWRWD